MESKDFAFWLAPDDGASAAISAADEILAYLNGVKYGSSSDVCDFCTANYSHIRINPNKVVTVKGSVFLVCWCCEKEARKIIRKRRLLGDGDDISAYVQAGFYSIDEIINEVFDNLALAEWLAGRLLSRQKQIKKRGHAVEQKGAA